MVDRSKDGVYMMDLNKVENINITPSKFRDLVLNKMVCSGPGFNIAYMPSTAELDTIADMMISAVSGGRLIDFGHWPNELIKKNSQRASDLYYEGALGHPFSTPWVFCHTWSDPEMDEKLGLHDHPSSAFYLVNPLLKGEKAVGCDFEIVAIETFNISGVDMLGIGDRAVLLAGLDRKDGAKYACQIIPVQFRFPQKYWDNYADDFGKARGMQSAMEAAGANVIEPAFLALLMINTRGIPREIVRASDKLNKARAKNKKYPIPPYTRVLSETYVTTLLRSSAIRGQAQGGHHASPITHIRLGHWRHYKTGERTFINDTLVKATEEMRELFKSSRTHYVMSEEPDTSDIPEAGEDFFRKAKLKLPKQ